jgi:transcription initiation factor TFIID subunit 1
MLGGQPLSLELIQMSPFALVLSRTDLTSKEGHVLLMEYSEERPPLLSLPGMGARLATYYRKRSSADGNAASLKTSGGFLGQIVPLEPAEPTPFLGQVPEGQSVTSLETSLYRAPAFRHKVPTTDFLLIRSNHGKLSLRKVTGLHLVGQEVWGRAFRIAGDQVQTVLALWAV